VNPDRINATDSRRSRKATRPNLPPRKPCDGCGDRLPTTLVGGLRLCWSCTDRHLEQPGQLIIAGMETQ
jgi:hypothetical protein